jgi:transposase-like protein
MDRGWLEERLAAGRSIESIAREVDRDPSTVSYWARKHGLQSAHAERHAARGGIERELLTAIVACGLPVRDMAEAMDLSPTTVRYWLAKHEITRPAAARRRAGTSASASKEARPDLRCPKHGLVPHVPRADGNFRCTRCRSEHVSDRRRRVKRLLVDEAGGACILCGYDRCLAALQFHHVDPAEKRFALSHGGVTRSIDDAREEAQRCALLCANCHAEVEAGVAQLPLRSAEPDVYPA